jgi:hypothetical protein
MLPVGVRFDRPAPVMQRVVRHGVACAILAALIAVGLCSCSNYQHRAYRLGKDNSVVHGNEGQPNEYELHFIESDDYGWFWDPAQATQAFDAVRKSVSDQDTIVLIFVAGWHHSAQCCDDNVEGFKEVLGRLRIELARKMYDQAREKIHGVSNSKPVKVLGIYLGWRGRSLPGWADYLTFWGRKAAAARVGETDFEEFLIRLRHFCAEHGQQSAAEFAKPPQSRRQNVLGLVTIGHSFGGQVVLRATASLLEHELTDISEQVGGGPAYLRTSTRSGSGTTPSTPVQGFGDLVVLINPAVEAAAYQRLHSLGMSLNYPHDQGPVMLTISADNDVPRHKLFRIGRILGEWFTSKPHLADPREREMERQSLGFFTDQVTHRIEPADPTMKLVGKLNQHPPEPACVGHDHCDFTWYTWAGQPKAEADSLSADVYDSSVVKQIGDYDLSSSPRTVFADVVMRPLSGAVPRQALIVASADERVITGHNGMFSEPLMNFLTRYIGFVEAKRLLPVALAAEAGSVGGAKQ